MTTRMLGSVSASVGPVCSGPGLRLHFGAAANRPPDGDAGDALLAVPCVGGDPTELLPPVPGDLAVGAEYVPVGEGSSALERATLTAYERILQRTGDGTLCRIWNYVPQINAQSEGLEQYRAFCRGRARAFEAAWGAGFTRRLPAASAVGGPPGVLVVLYAVAAGPARPVENPEQVPAYAYPPEHGPRSPSFCRAMCVTGAAHDWVFVSGTAAIKGHRTIAPGQLAPQIATTVDNLRLVSAACGLGSDLGLAAGWRRHFKVYLRHAYDFEPARAGLATDLLAATDSVVWLRADICRADLAIEIEATLWRAR